MISTGGKLVASLQQYRCELRAITHPASVRQDWQQLVTKPYLATIIFYNDRLWILSLGYRKIKITHLIASKPTM